MNRFRIAVLASLALVVAACAAREPAPTPTPAAGPHKQATSPANAQRLAPYSTAVRTGNLVFFSGVIGSRQDQNDTTVAAFEGEAQRALESLRNNLTSVGLTPDDVVKCTVFLIDMAHYSPMNKVYGAFFGTTNPPARSAIAVRALPANARIEVECIAAAR